jgi:hypothetical protein
MARAICNEAGGHEVAWYGGRGRKLADLKCPEHGTPLHGKTSGKANGAGIIICPVDGVRRRSGTRTTKVPDVEFYVAAAEQPFYVRGVETPRNPGPFPAGTVICWHHAWEPTAPSLPGGTA